MKSDFPVGKIKKIIVFVAFVICFAAFCNYQNNSIVVTESVYANTIIPKDFNGYKIAHISDLHNKRFGKNQHKLLDKLKALSPDIIVITGDLIDRRKYNLETAMEFINGSINIAPVYYVSGNHEAWSGKYSVIKERLTEAGACILDDMSVNLTKNDSAIKLIGLSDPDFLTSSYIERTNISNMEKHLAKWSNIKDFTILLSHRPELMDLYSENNIDLIFTGHAHGGQIRLPFIGGLIAPGQGLFPKYTSGSYKRNSSTMYVSRGLGNSIFPVRVFNRPEIVVVTLMNKR